MRSLFSSMQNQNNMEEEAEIRSEDGKIEIELNLVLLE